MMKIILQASSDDDVQWFLRYYRDRFPEGQRSARLQLTKTLDNLAANPQLGHPVEGTDARELAVSRTPFTLIYRIRDNRIEILRLWDGRADPARLGDPEDETP